MRVGIDLMGGDRSPHYVLEAVESLSLPEGVELVLFAEEGTIEGASHWIMGGPSVLPTDAPLLAVRRKKNSSMLLGINALKEKKIDTFLSTGNTGVLMASALLHLPKLPSIQRPALMVHMPNGKQGVVVLDVGANITVRPPHLLEFAKMGAAYRQEVEGMAGPRIGLLNVGGEEKKGSHELKETYQLLQSEFGPLFIGNVEGREVFQGKVDVLVTDGFTGNVFLKTCEGISSFFTDYIGEKFQVAEAQAVVEHMHREFDYAEHPGALLCGVDGLVFKCHGSSNARALINGVKGAIAAVRSNVLQKMRGKL